MARYRIANLTIDSVVALPAPAVAAREGGAWRFTVRRGGRAPARLAWYHHELEDDGTPWRSLARDGERHVVRFRRQATFVIAGAERRITCHPAAAASIETVRQLFVGHVLPLVFAEAGALALHASAVRTPDGVLAFVGPTRRGKSTIAAALAARGCPLVADDCAIVEVEAGECRVRPMHVGLRLWPDSLRVFPRSRPGLPVHGRSGTKSRVTAGALGLAIHHSPAPLHRVYLLDAAHRGAAVTVTPVSGPEAVLALLVASFQVGMDRPGQLRRSFESLSTLAARVPVRRLRRPRGLRHLPQLVQTVLDDARL